MTKNKFSIDDYFTEARHTAEERPLMAIEGVETVLTEARREQRAVQRNAEAKKTSWTALLGGVGLAAATTAGLVLLTSSPKEAQRKSAPVEQESAPQLIMVAPSVNTWDNQIPVEADSKTDRDKEESHFTVTPQDAAPESIGGTALMTLSPEALGQLGVTMSGSRAVYQGSRAASIAELAEYYNVTPDQMRAMIQKDSTLLRHRIPTKVAIRTNGIGSVPADTDASDTILSAPAPRIVSTYVHGKLMASYWDKKDAEIMQEMQRKYTTLDAIPSDSSVNLLIPIHFKLEDKKSAHFKEADVVLWYAATPAVVRALPEQYRNQLKQELAVEQSEEPQVKAVPGERFMENWRTSSGAILSTMLYPNPATGAKATLRYTLTEDRMVTISLHDIFGRRMMEVRSEHVGRGEQETMIPLQNIESGMYLVVITTDNKEQAVQRLLIQR